MADAAVWLTGTGQDKQLNFRLPTGGKGDKGDKGDRGADGSNVLPTDTAIRDAINNTASETHAALNTAYVKQDDPNNARLRPGTIALLGDSITAMNHSQSGVVITANSFGFWPHTSHRLNGRLRHVTRPGTLNGGVSGENTAQILARVQQDVVALKPGYAHVLAGTNDVIGTVPLATTLANLTAIYNAIQNAGIRLIVGTIPPFSGGTTAQLVNIDQINQFIRDQARARPGVILADYHAVLASDTGSWRVVGTTAYAGDDRHPSTGGAMRMAKVLAEALLPVIPAGSVLPTSNIDSYANRASFTTPNLAVNPMTVGTAGSPNGSGLTNIPDGWTINTFDGSATSTLSVITSAKVARTDGIVGEWWQATLPSVASKVRLQQSIGVGGTLPVAGDRVWAHAEFELENTTDLDILRIQLHSFDATAGFAGRGSVTDFNMNTVDKDTYPVDHLPARGVLSTPVLTVPNTNITGWALYIDVAAAGKFRLGRVVFRRERG